MRTYNVTYNLFMIVKLCTSHEGKNID